MLLHQDTSIPIASHSPGTVLSIVQAFWGGQLNLPKNSMEDFRMDACESQAGTLLRHAPPAFHCAEVSVDGGCGPATDRCLDIG